MAAWRRDAARRWCAPRELRHSALLGAAIVEKEKKEKFASRSPRCSEAQLTGSRCAAAVVVSPSSN
jgi:hypothetical protein